MIRKHDRLTIWVILIALHCAADADQRQVLDIDPVNLCEFVSRAGTGLRPEVEIPSEVDGEAKSRTGKGIHIVNLAPETASNPVCYSHPNAYGCVWHFAAKEAANSKYLGVLTELQACVSRSEIWTDSELHPQTCTTRFLPSSLMQEQVQSQSQETDPLTSVSQGNAVSLYEAPTTHLLSARTTEGMILHRHDSDEAVSLLLDLASTSVAGGFNPKPTIHSFSTRLSIVWVKHDDIDPEVCADNLKLREYELNRVEQILNRASRPTGDSDSNEDKN